MLSCFNGHERECGVAACVLVDDFHLASRQLGVACNARIPIASRAGSRRQGDKPPSLECVAILSGLGPWPCNLQSLPYRRRAMKRDVLGDNDIYIGNGHHSHILPTTRWSQAMATSWFPLSASDIRALLWRYRAARPGHCTSKHVPKSSHELSQTAIYSGYRVAWRILRIQEGVSKEFGNFRLSRRFARIEPYGQLTRSSSV